MGFLDILDWMVANSPGFMRPAVSWIVGGIRSVVNHIASTWNALGTSVITWAHSIDWSSTWQVSFAVKVLHGFTWVRNVYIPWVIGVATQALRSAIDQTSLWLYGLIVTGYTALQQIIGDVVREFGELILDLKRYAAYWIDRIVNYTEALVRALEHVLNGPEHLATWLVGAMWQASLRFMYAQRDRIALWFTRESEAATRWLATELENIIMRWM